MQLDLVDLSAWRSKITEEIASKGDDEELEIGEVIQQVSTRLNSNLSISACNPSILAIGKETRCRLPSTRTIPKRHVDYRMRWSAKRYHTIILQQRAILKILLIYLFVYLNNYYLFNIWQLEKVP